MNPIIAERVAELETLCVAYSVIRLKLFGSAAKGNYRPGQSDLDFLVEFHDLPEGSYANNKFGFQEALEDLFQCPVDLIVDSSIKNPYFRQSVDSTEPLSMQLAAKTSLYDVQQAAGHIAEFTQGVSFTEYQSSLMMRSAVERQFQIIGEAINRLSQIDPDTASRITDHRKIVDFRNQLTHGYLRVDDSEVWGVIQNYLPILAKEVAAILRED